MGNTSYVGNWRGEFTGSASGNGTTSTVSLYAKIGRKGKGTLATATYNYKVGTSSGGTQIASGGTSLSKSGWTSSGQSRQIWSGTVSVTTTHSTQSKTYYCSFQYHTSSTTSDWYTASVTVTIPARASYAVSYNANGGTGAPGGQTKWYSETLTLQSSTPTRDGYTFSHWNTASDGSGTDYYAGGTYTGNAALTLYAMWDSTLTYDANGHGTAPSAQTMYHASATIAEDISPVPGCIFMGWNTEADGSGVGYIAGSTVKQAKTFRENTILYAQWELGASIQVKVDETWVNGTPYIKENGIWKAVNEIYAKVNNEWKVLGTISEPNINLLLDSKMDDRTTFASCSDTDFSKPLRYYNGDASIHSFQILEDGIYKDVVTLNSAANLGIAFARLASDISLDSNSYYTLSCYASCTQSGAHLDIGLSYYNTSNAWVWRGGANPQYFQSVNTPQRFALTFKPDADTQAIMYCFTVVGVASGTDTFTIYNCKLEKGSFVTDWLPAPED